MFSEEHFQPAFGETDANGHLTNTAMPLWFERARLPLFRIFRPELDPRQWNLILAHLEFDFRAQLFFGREVHVRTWIEKIGNSSFTIAQSAGHADDLDAVGCRAVIVYFDYATQKSAPLTAAQRRALQTYTR
jgi:acyl-CoA thioester hydrolase